MRTRFITAALALTTSAAAAVAQQHGGHQPQHQASKHAQPYAGQQAREVASLSAEELNDIKAGRGMGLAKAEEVSARGAEATRWLGEVRLAHLIAHVEITPLLTPEQCTRYAELRGYADSGAPQHKHKH